MHFENNNPDNKPVNISHSQLKHYLLTLPLCLLAKILISLSNNFSYSESSVPGGLIWYVFNLLDFFSSLFVIGQFVFPLTEFKHRWSSEKLESESQKNRNFALRCAPKPASDVC